MARGPGCRPGRREMASKCRSMSTASSELPSPAELQVQIHPALAPDLDLSALRACFVSLAETEASVLRSKLEEGDDDGAYVNLMFKTSDRARLWRAVERELYEHPLFGQLLGQSSMALCTGESGWDDYLLLHHFNPAFELDTLGET